MTPLELIEDAAEKIDTFRHPDIDEATELLHNILVAAGIGGISDDRVERLRVGHNTVEIRTRYSVRQCDMSSDYEFPTSILRAADPIVAAREYGRLRKIATARSDIAKYAKEIEDRQARIATAKALIAELDRE